MKKAYAVSVFFGLLSLGLVTGLMMHAGPAPAPEDIAGDSLALHASDSSTHGDGELRAANKEEIGSAAAESGAASVASAEALDAVDTTAGNPATGEENSAVAQQDPDFAAEVLAAQQRFGKIFASMDAEAAAEVLQRVEDDALIRGVLLSIQPRKAAEILTLLPRDRAALISAPAMPSKPLQ